MSFLQNVNFIIDWSIQKLQWRFSQNAKIRIKILRVDQKTVAVVNQKNDNVAKNERNRNKLNVFIIIAIDYDEFEKICKNNNLQLLVFQYDNISDKVTIVISISNKKK